MDIRQRHEAVLRSLRRQGLISLGSLAAEVGVSRRTLLRDIGALREQGYLIHSEAGRGGGVLLDPQSVQVPTRLSAAEVMALLVSIAVLRASGSLPFAGLADSGLAKIERALPPERLQDLRSFLDRLHIGRLAPEQDLSDLGRVEEELVDLCEAAFLRRQCLAFRYRDAKGRETSRHVEPQAMLLLPPLWYLVAWDPAREDFRHFRMDRISAARLIEGQSFRLRRVPFEADVCPYRALAGSGL